MSVIVVMLPLPAGLHCLYYPRVSEASPSERIVTWLITECFRGSGDSDLLLSSITVLLEF